LDAADPLRSLVLEPILRVSTVTLVASMVAVALLWASKRCFSSSKRCSRSVYLSVMSDFSWTRRLHLVSRAEILSAWSWMVSSMSSIFAFLRSRDVWAATRFFSFLEKAIQNMLITSCYRCANRYTHFLCNFSSHVRWSSFLFLPRTKNSSKTSLPQLESDISSG
jgi:hypothetical protein